VKKFEALQTTELVVGSTGPGSGFHIMATLLRNMFGAKLRTIAGYESGPHLLNAVERQETQGTCGIAMASIAISHPHWLRDKLINFLVQTGLERDQRPELAGVPMAYEMAKTAEQKAVMDVLFATGQMDRPVLVPPGVPAARVAALRAALKATLEDRDLLAETQKSRVPIIYVAGEELQSMLARVYASPPSVIKAVVEVMQ
jgi:tripartite-type tricarboxylate transporter receptor subunit TctC